jgi:hypothetical protein
MLRSPKLALLIGYIVMCLPGTALPQAQDDPPLPSYAQTALKRQGYYMDDRWPGKLKEVSNDVALLRKERRASRAVSGAQIVLKTIDSLDRSLDEVLSFLRRRDVPENHSRFQALRKKVEGGHERLAELANECKSLKSRAERGMDVRNYPDYKRDLSEFKRIREKFASYEGWDRHAEKLEALLKFRKEESGKLIHWYNERGRFYGWFLAAGTKESKALKSEVMRARRQIVRMNTQLDSYTKGYATTALGKLGSVETMAVNSRGSGRRFSDRLAREKLASAREFHARLERLHSAESETVKNLKSRIEKVSKLIDRMAAAQKDAVATERGGEIVAMLNEAEKHAGEALSRKDVNWMKGARGKLREAKALLDKLEQTVGGHAKAEEARERYTEIAANMKKVGAKLRDTIIGQARAPKDVYEGPDQAKWKDLVLRRWRELYPKDNIHSVRFPRKNWRRTTKWEFDEHKGAWHRVDKSVLEVTVIVLTSGRIATLYPCYCHMDHTTREKSIGAHTKRGPYCPQEMLAQNLEE